MRSMRAGISTATFVVMACAVLACSSSDSAGGSPATGGSAGIAEGGVGGSAEGGAGIGGSSGKAGSGGQGQGGSAGQAEGGQAGASGQGGVAGEAGSPSDAGTDAAACAQPANPAPTTIDQHASVAMPTDQAGGTIASGTYYRTQYVKYDASDTDTDTRQSTLVVDASAGSFNVIDTDLSASTDPTFWGYGTFTTSGTTMTGSLTCPQVAQVPWPYTATATTFKLYESSKQRVSTYTKQ